MVRIGSSSVITKSAEVSERVPLDGSDKVKVAVSVSSASVSLVMGISIVASVCPAVTVTVPVVPV